MGGFKIGDLVIHPDTKEPSTITDVITVGFDGDDDCNYYELDEGDLLFTADLLVIIKIH